MSLEALSIAGPGLVGTPVPSRDAWVIQSVWKEERENPNSVFKRSPLDYQREEGRLEPILFYGKNASDRGKFEFIRGLHELTMFCHYQNEHGESRWGRRIALLTDVLTEAAPAYPDVTAIYSVEDAAKGFWT